MSLIWGSVIRGQMPPTPHSFLPKIFFFFATELKRGTKNWAESGEKGVYVQLGLVQTDLPPLSNFTA
jgi:hypothetical protein